MNRVQLISVGVLAAGALLLESTLTRLLAVAQFYHFAFLAVSLALLGFGASGSLLTLRPGLLEDGPGGRPAGSRLLAFSGTAFALSVALAYAVVNLLPFDSYSIAWDRRQLIFFILYYLSLSLPFVFAGLGIGGALACSRARSHLVYGSNLLGSALGVLLAPLLLWLAGVPGSVLGSALAGLIVAWINRPVSRGLSRWFLSGAFTCGLAGFALLAVSNQSGLAPLGVTISPYKGLAYARQYPGSTRLFGKWNAISRVDILAGAGTRALPGLSYTYPENPPSQLGLSVDADSLQPVTLVPPDRFAAASYLPEALVFQLEPEAHVLVLEPGAGLGVLQAVTGGATQVVAVSSNPLVLEGVNRTADNLDIYSHPNVRSLVENPRSFLRKGQSTYDVIYLPLTNAYRPVTSGAYSLAETYLLTEQAFAHMLGRLEEGGILVASRWLQLPPSEDLRLIATLAEALEVQGSLHADQALVAYRGIQTITVLVKPSGWSGAELAALRQFAGQRRYDLVWAPGIQPEETNRYNRLPESVYYRQVSDLLRTTQRGEFYAAYPYAIQPPTDNRPFFFHFFTWKQTPELLATFGKTMQPFGGSGYFILLALLTLVGLLSLLLIVTPLVMRRSTTGQAVRPGHVPLWRVLVYFSSLGLAFLFIEIPLVQRWILLLGHPTYAFTLVVLVLLSFSSLGSFLARAPWLPRKPALAILVGLALLTPWLMGRFSDLALGWPLPALLLGGILILAPLAVLMGLPFPLGLAWLEQGAPGLVPWAWAINGCASVIAAVLAAILALGSGFNLVLLCGAGFYALAISVLPGQRDEANPSQVGRL
ncbi:MAG TPA: hypothetical protein VI776_11615 [Anaerolineales bacterium]|nr:hypothetical protein [Anaerolineales bacterium]